MGKENVAVEIRSQVAEWTFPGVGWNDRQWQRFLDREGSAPVVRRRGWEVFLQGGLPRKGRCEGWEVDIDTSEVQPWLDYAESVGCTL